MEFTPETARLLLQNKFDRIENLVKINHQSTLAVPSILAAIWGVEGGLNNFRNAWLLGVITIGLLLIWRYFAHYIDDDIAKTYIQIIKLENHLKVPPDCSLFNNLVETIADPIKSNSNNNAVTIQKITELINAQRVKFFQILYENKKWVIVDIKSGISLLFL